ncbi:circadian clock protein KaiB [Jiella mangrovi]|uniref:Circadian clock protein KaiB n=1 Tax=Jiella mangrovi TaxID=2821407 RepID=A0ABS4BN39_9HYPH|nr:circadian clock protein KaiB [Jiella mangrovi]MBP0618144.1 circadian clock protein KaiB [Jiella mangrovi]
MIYRLRLFITGRTPHSIRALDNLRSICETELAGRYEVEIIDVLENPGLADIEKILATPTLVRKLPEPVRKIIGDLSDREKVLLGLDVYSTHHENASIQTGKE